MMLNQWANRLTDTLYRHCPIDSSRRQVYVYGFELLISTSSSILSILVLSALLSLPHYAVIFLTVFISLRLFNGGFHAKTYGRCFFLTNAVYVAVLIATLFFQNILPASTHRAGYILITFVAITVIIVLSPIRHVKHPLSEERYRYNQKIGRCLALVILLLNCVLLWCPISSVCPILISITLIAVAIMMIIPKFTERRQ